MSCFILQRGWWWSVQKMQRWLMVDDSNYGQNDNNGQGDISGGRGGGGSGGTGDVEDNGGIEIRWKWRWRWWDWGGSCNTIFMEFLPPYFTLFGTLSFVP